MSCSTILLKRKTFTFLSAAGSLLNAAGSASMVAGTVQASQQMKQSEEQFKKQQQQEIDNMKRQAEINKKQAELDAKNQMKIEQLRSKTAIETAKIQNDSNNNFMNMNNALTGGSSGGNPMAAPQNNPEMATKGFSEKSSIRLKRRVFGVVSDLGQVALNNKGHLLGHIATGLTMGATGVVAGSLITRNMKKQGIDVNAMKSDIERQEGLQKQMSASEAVAEGVENVGKETWGKAVKGAAKGMVNPMGLGFGALFEIPNAISYSKNIDTLKARYGKNVTRPVQEQYSAKSKTSIKVKRINGVQKNFGFTAGKIIDPKGFIQHPGKSLMGFASMMSMGGGNKGVNSFTEQLKQQGMKSGNQTTVKIGQWLQDHPKTALAGSIPVGLGIMKVTFDAGDKVARKVGEKINPDYNVYEKWSEING